VFSNGLLEETFAFFIFQVCEDSTCTRITADIMRYMNVSVDPCEVGIN